MTSDQVNLPEPSMYHGRREETDMSIGDWQGYWKTGIVYFHKDHRHPLLVEFYEEFTHGAKNLKMLFPLCGKSVDMKWMLDEGHTVVGIEACEQAIKEFFAETGIAYTVSQCPKLSYNVYKGKDVNITIYNGDLYSFSSDVEGVFDAIWDRGSFISINKEDRQRYVKLMLSLMAPDCRYFVCTFEYDPQVHVGPPNFLSDEEVQLIYGPTCEVILLSDKDVIANRKRQEGPKHWFEKLHRVIKKSDSV